MGVRIIGKKFEIACTFCWKYQREVKLLISGPAAFICNECVGLCVDIMTEEAEKKAEANEDKKD